MSAANIVANPWSWLLLLLVVPIVRGAVPVILAYLMAASFPKGHPRRRETIAELKVIPLKERLMWVGSQLGVVLVEGISARRQARRSEPTFTVNVGKLLGESRRMLVHVTAETFALEIESENLVSHIYSDRRPSDRDLNFANLVSAQGSLSVQVLRSKVLVIVHRDEPIELIIGFRLLPRITMGRAYPWVDARKVGGNVDNRR